MVRYGTMQRQREQRSTITIIQAKDDDYEEERLIQTFRPGHRQFRLRSWYVTEQNKCRPHDHGH